MKKKITWYKNMPEDRQDSIWYGGAVAEVKCKGHTFVIGAYGDIRILIDEEYYVDKNNTGYIIPQALEEHNIHNDAELYKAIDNGKIEFLNNNWFEYWTEGGDCYDTIDDFSSKDDFGWIDDIVQQLGKEEQ